MSAQLRQMAQELGVAQRVLFLGEVDQAALVAALKPTCWTIRPVMAL